MTTRYGKPARRAKANRRVSRLPWLVGIAVVALLAMLGGLYVWGEQQSQAQVSGKLVAERLTQDIGTVPYAGGLAKARFALTAQGGPVVVKSISTT